MKSRRNLLSSSSLNWPIGRLNFKYVYRPRTENERRDIKTTVNTDHKNFVVDMSSSHRGVVITNAMEIKDNSVYLKSSFIDESELRRSLLFWDRIVWPSTSGLFFPGNVDTEFLQQEGILVRPHFNINGDAATALSISLIQTYETLNKLQPGKWIISAGEKSLKNHGIGVSEGRGVVTQLLNAIPVPDKSMPLEDIILFKQSREAEIIELRTAIDEFYQSWVNSEDKDHQFQLAINKIDIACASMIKVARENRGSFNLSSWKLNFNITVESLAKGIGMAALSGATLSSASSLLIGAASMFSISRDVGFQSSDSNSPFNYVASMHSKL